MSHQNSEIQQLDKRCLVTRESCIPTKSMIFESYVWFPTSVLRETDGEYGKTAVNGGPAVVSVVGRAGMPAHFIIWIMHTLIVRNGCIDLLLVGFALF
jgi:hypothetical protein